MSDEMSGTQLRLWPDAQPLVERLGRDFFRGVPECPGVYLMKGAEGLILYVGKAKNLRKRLGSYRVANPERMRRRHLRLVNSVGRIDFELCSDEREALRRESELLRMLKPKFNRAGVWQAPKKYLAWRINDRNWEAKILEQPEAGWRCLDRRGSAVFARQSSARLMWCLLQPERGLHGMPSGWVHGRLPEVVQIPSPGNEGELFDALAGGNSGAMRGWFDSTFTPQAQTTHVEKLRDDLENVEKFFGCV